jgi:uncharacterized repeat protein (TIGR01451 family)
LNDTLNRALAVMVCALLLAAPGGLDLTPLHAMASSSAYPEPSYLVVITYNDWDGLQRLATLGLYVLDLQFRVPNLLGEGVLAAVVTPQELATLRSLGFAVRILDSPTTLGQYYLVTLPPERETSHALSAAEGFATPNGFEGQVFPYVADTFILKADPAEAELLPREGFFIQKLFGPIVLPALPPSAETAAPTVLAQGYNPLIQNLVNAVDQTQIEDTIRNLQDDQDLWGWDAQGSRYSYSSELAEERDYIRDSMEALGLDKIQEHPFSLGGTTQYNIEGTLNGWGPGSDVVYIVCAHYDSVSGDPYNTAPGADDNASGTAAVLEAARVLSPYRFKHTLRFVTFAAEEQGLIGSYYYAAEARSVGTNIGGVINLDMVAWDSEGDNEMDVHAGTRSDSQALGTAFVNAISTYGITLEPQTITLGATTASDHARFWNQGYPALLAIEDFQDFNPYYHQTSDTLGTLDLPYAAKFVQTTVATLAELAEIIPPGVRVEHIGSGAVMTDTLTALTITYANPGLDPATGVVITDTLSPGLTYVEDSNGFTMTQPVSGTVVWQVGDMMSHTQSSFVVTASVAAALPVGAHVTSTVEITGVVAWDNPADNQATWTGFVPYARYYFPIIFNIN